MTKSKQYSFQAFVAELQLDTMNFKNYMDTLASDKRMAKEKARGVLKDWWRKEAFV